MSTVVDYVMACVSIVGAVLVAALLLGSYSLARPSYKNDKLLSRKARKLGYGG